MGVLASRFFNDKYFSLSPQTSPFWEEVTQPEVNSRHLVLCSAWKLLGPKTTPMDSCEFTNTVSTVVRNVQFNIISKSKPKPGIRNVVTYKYNPSMCLIWTWDLLEAMLILYIVNLFVFLNCVKATEYWRYVMELLWIVKNMHLEPNHE
jgi:hypothetical protein